MYVYRFCGEQSEIFVTVEVLTETQKIITAW